jgi:uncharacterized protein YecE (DUF72 family)
VARGRSRRGGATLSADADEGADGAALAGCCGFCGPRAEYFDKLSLVELQDTFRALPRAGTVARWRAEAPSDFTFAMRAAHQITHERPPAGAGSARDTAAPGQSGLLRPTPTVRAATEQTLAVARQLDARAILFETPLEFTPTAINRRNLTAFFSAIPRDGRLLVWHPQGVWADGQVLRICADLDLVPATTVISAEPVAALPRRYFRLNAPRFTEDDFWLLADQMQDCDEAYCVFNSRAMLHDAQRLQALLSDR